MDVKMTVMFHDSDFSTLLFQDEPERFAKLLRAAGKGDFGAFLTLRDEFHVVVTNVERSGQTPTAAQIEQLRPGDLER